MFFFPVGSDDGFMIIYGTLDNILFFHRTTHTVHPKNSRQKVEKYSQSIPEIHPGFHLEYEFL